MKALLLIVALLFVSSAFAKWDVEKEFSDFEQKYGKTYAGEVERNYRMKVFHENLIRSEKMNAEHGSEVFGVTKFMDLTPQEFKNRYLRSEMPHPLPEAPSKPVLEVADPDTVPATVDWRNKTDVITPVKNQEQCGSCWAFSVTESIESAWVLAGNSQEILGPQQIVDCDTSDGGCNGGTTPTAYEYVISAGGQETEQDYPYTAQNGQCKFNKADIAAKISSWHYVSQSGSSESTTMLTYVANSGPVSVCVDASTWQTYKGGVLRQCGSQIDHCVQVVGFGLESGMDFADAGQKSPIWFVRNSWGADWGEQGYIWVERGKNLCEIATIVTAASA